MVTTLRISVFAVGLVALAGCSGMTSSRSAGTAPTATQQTAGYIVPRGYVSGQHIIPYEGRIASKCDHYADQNLRANCIRSEGGR